MRLNTGHWMPILALGTGGMSKHTYSMLVEAASLGYQHFDTSDVYPAFRNGAIAEGLAALAARRQLRSCYFLTSKVDVTSPPDRARQCATNGTGCFEVIRQAVDSQLLRLDTPYIDLMLLHRPPSLKVGFLGQCTQVQEMFRGLEAAMTSGQVRAIGVSNFCVELLRCLLRTSATVPSVIQSMHRLGMGPDPFGYVSWARSLGIHYMAYSVLGGADGTTKALLTAPSVKRVAAARGISSAEVAILWVVQQQLPLVLLSNTVHHLASNLRLVANPPARLSTDDMAALSMLTKPRGRPSHWGDCVDTPAPQQHPLTDLVRGIDEASRLRCAAGGTFSQESGVLPQELYPGACEDVAWLRGALVEAVGTNRDIQEMNGRRVGGATMTLPPVWAPLEGSELKDHPDPLGALQRNEVPALILRGLVPEVGMHQMRHRVASMAVRAPLADRESCMCAHISPKKCPSGWLSAANCFNNGSSTAPHCPERAVPRGHVCSWGEKLAFALATAQVSARKQHFARCGRVNANVEKLAATCRADDEHAPAHWCTPQSALWHGVQQIVGRRRKLAMGTEPTGEVYNVGSLSAMPAGFAYPMHFDSLHASAWITLRDWFCAERVPFGKRLNRKWHEPSLLREFAMLRRHSFAAAAIFTVQAPKRSKNHFDLRIYKVRWQAMVRNCTLRSTPSGGIYQRVTGVDPFQGTQIHHVDIVGNPGDLYLFNSENFHITPEIVGPSARTVLTAIAAYSEDSDTVEIYG